MSKFAIIETGGKQYRVAAGDKVKVEKLSAAAQKGEPSQGLAPGADFVFDKVLLRAAGDKVEIGVPYVTGAKVHAKVVRQARERKVIVFKYHSKTRYRKKKGHRQHFTEVEII
jgi:large subunit ribosomal protein L21